MIEFNPKPIDEEIVAKLMFRHLQGVNEGATFKELAKWSSEAYEALRTLEAALRVVRAAQEVHDDIFRITVNPDQHHENVMKLKEALAPFEDSPRDSDGI